MIVSTRVLQPHESMLDLVIQRRTGSSYAREQLEMPRDREYLGVVYAAAATDVRRISLVRVVEHVVIVITHDTDAVSSARLHTRLLAFPHPPPQALVCVSTLAGLSLAPLLGRPRARDAAALALLARIVTCLVARLPCWGSVHPDPAQMRVLACGVVG